jgi:dTDP-4-amino-4,6-dideoxygalactose transaminase
MIPQTSPAAGYAKNKEQIDAAVARVMDSGWYILGKEVEAFEKAFSRYVEVAAGVGVASGTDAIEIALRACDIGPGDLVFTVSHTAVATVAGIQRSGANVALVDIDPDTYSMSPDQLEQTIRSAADGSHGRPAAIVPVHLYGQPADMPRILEIANRHGLTVVEDAAQAHGSALQGRQTGSWGRAAAFSFYPTKNLAAFGDGGMVLTDDPKIAARVRQLREYGWRDRFVSAAPGLNSRLDELQAAILNVRLQTLDEDNELRRQIALTYDEALCESQLVTPCVRPSVEHVYHQYVVRTERRDELRDYLSESHIATAIHYPVAIHQQPAYQNRFLGSDRLPRTEDAAGKILSLPMYPQLEPDQQDQVIQAIQSWCS